MTAPDDIDAAIARAQQQMEHPKKTKRNPAFKTPSNPEGSAYSDLADVVNAVRPALNAQGIAVIQRIVDGELVTEFRRNGEVRDSRLALNLNGKPQEVGSQITYWRRFELAALAGVASEDDDDGNAASAASRRSSSRPAQAQGSSKPDAPKVTINADGERLASKEQAAEFTVLCEHLEMDRAERAAMVDRVTGKSKWSDVTREDATKLVATLKGNQLDTYQSGDGKWHVITAGEDAPFMDEPADA